MNRERGPKMDGDMLDSLNKYEEDDQKSIMRTLTAVQKKGWKNGQDPFQFYIILGSVIREREKEIKDFEGVLEHNTDQINQKDHCINKLKDDLKNEKSVNEELEEELKIKEVDNKNL